MSKPEYVLIGQNYKNTSHVPKGEDIFYRCDECGIIISSVPENSAQCRCRNVTIDADYLRLVVRDMDKMSVVKKI